LEFNWWWGWIGYGGYLIAWWVNYARICDG
jgi:hypothetical protein